MMISKLGCRLKRCLLVEKTVGKEAGWLFVDVRVACAPAPTKLYVACSSSLKLISLEKNSWMASIRLEGKVIRFQSLELKHY